MKKILTIMFLTSFIPAIGQTSKKNKPTIQKDTTEYIKGQIMRTLRYSNFRTEITYKDSITLKTTKQLTSICIPQGCIQKCSFIQFTTWKNDSTYNVIEMDKKGKTFEYEYINKKLTTKKELEKNGGYKYLSLTY